MCFFHRISKIVVFQKQKEVEDEYLRVSFWKRKMRMSRPRGGLEILYCPIARLHISQRRHVELVPGGEMERDP